MISRGNPGGKEITMDEIKLKPCPFYGEVPIPIGHGMSSGDSIFWVRCFGCAASTTLFNYTTVECDGRTIKRPPQSWCYVEELQSEEVQGNEL